MSLLRLLVCCFLLVTSPGWSAELSGRVVAITDGDTLTLLVEDNRRIKIRLAGIDAPESHQPYCNRARQELSELTFQKQVRIEVLDLDRYGRTIGRVWDAAIDINAEMVRRGAAWVYRQYNRDPALPPLEAEARQAKRGLWALPPGERRPPWIWRHSDQRPAFLEPTQPVLPN